MLWLTLEVQKFNKHGFYSNVPGDNINIEGGIPDSLRNALKNNSCNSDQLSNCIVPSFNGIVAPSAKTMNEGIGKIGKIGNEVKNVYANPVILHKIDNPIYTRAVETVSGMLYI